MEPARSAFVEFSRENGKEVDYQVIPVVCFIVCSNPALLVEHGTRTKHILKSFFNLLAETIPVELSFTLKVSWAVRMRFSHFKFKSLLLAQDATE